MPERLWTSLCWGAVVVSLHAATRLLSRTSLAGVTILRLGARAAQTTSIGAAGIFRPGFSTQRTVQLTREIMDESWRYTTKCWPSEHRRLPAYANSGYFYATGPQEVQQRPP